MLSGVQKVKGCATCRCKAAADLQVIEHNMKEIANVLRKSHVIGDRMLREGCGKKPENPCQESEDIRSKPCTKKMSPCKAPNPCSDYDDYDPCETNEDITEKDLNILLKEEQDKLRREKEEQDKLRREKEAAEAELRKQQGQLQGTAKSSEQGADADWRETDYEKPCHRTKKRLCRKPNIQNPFFKNRLSFSSDLPPPPPIPPPQFLPLVDVSDSKPKICLKRKKKCKKKSEAKEGLGLEDGTEEEEEEEEGGEGKGGALGLDGEGQGECLCLYEDECLEDEFDNMRKGRRKCKKPERPPCRKKDSDLDTALQPRKIPAIQKDLPPTSPKDIPEMERQILMACEKDREIYCPKKKCKKKS